MNPETFQVFSDAIARDDTDLVEQLVRNRPESLHDTTPFGTWLHVAASHGNLQMVQKLVSLGFDINARAGVSSGNPLHIAASEGHCNVVTYLLGQGAQMDVSEPNRNPLFAAILNGHFEVAKLLLERGIDFKRRYSGESMQEMDALSFAQERGRSSFVTLLRKYFQRQH